MAEECMVMDPEEMEYILFEMFGVNNDEEYEETVECWNND